MQETGGAAVMTRDAAVDEYGENKDRMRWKDRVRVMILAGMLAGLGLTGCSRETMNYQLAESIGTLGKYENNEPVETPQMQVAREQAEAEAAAEAALQEQLDAAANLALGYQYEEAIALLQGLTGEDAQDEKVTAAIAAYQADQDSMTAYEGDVPHLCFPGMIEDSMRAFDGDDMSYTYSSSMITTQEFRAILQQLYENGYVLVDIHDIARETTDDRGVTTVDRQELLLPAGKKPLVLSQDNLNYSGIVNGDGIATKLVLDEDGNVGALYTDEGGHDLKGDYDFIPILDSFVAEHPDFSLRGAKGIVSVSGSDGVFGYQVADTAVTNFEDNRTAVTAIASRLTETGWHIASAGYSHTYLNDMSLESLQSDTDKWLEEVGTLIGTADILFYPYGGEVAYPSDQLTCLEDAGFIYLCGLWGDTDYTELGDGYMRQTRRFIDGYTLENTPDNFSGFFSVPAILDEDR